MLIAFEQKLYLESHKVKYWTTIIQYLFDWSSFNINGIDIASYADNDTP